MTEISERAIKNSLFRWLWYFPDRCKGKLIKLFWRIRYPGLDFAMDYDTEFDKQAGFGFEAVSQAFFLEIIRRTPFPKNEIRFLDIGCGKGNTLVTATKCGLAKVGGVELSDKFFKACKNNMRILGYDDVALFHRNATLMETELDDFNVIYLYNPFPGEVMKSFLVQLKESVKRVPRRVCITYLRPLFAEVFEELGFRETQRFELETFYYLNKAIFYEL